MTKVMRLNEERIKRQIHYKIFNNDEIPEYVKKENVAGIVAHLIIWWIDKTQKQAKKEGANQINFLEKKEKNK